MQTLATGSSGERKTFRSKLNLRDIVIGASVAALMLTAAINNLGERESKVNHEYESDIFPSFQPAYALTNTELASSEQSFPFRPIMPEGANVKNLVISVQKDGNFQEIMWFDQTTGVSQKCSLVSDGAGQFFWDDEAKTIVKATPKIDETGAIVAFSPNDPNPDRRYVRIFQNNVRNAQGDWFTHWEMQYVIMDESQPMQAFHFDQREFKPVN